jgi:site-specific DNA recombinase
MSATGTHAKLDVRVLFTDAPALTDDPQSRLLTQVQGVIAEYERAKIHERYRRGKLYRSRLGEVVAWKAPYGYRRIPRDESGMARLEIYEPEAAVVRQIFADVVDRGLSVRQVVHGLYDEGVPSPTGRPMWGCSTVSRMLRNEAYIGRVYYNRTQLVPTRPGAKKATRQMERPRGEWISIPVPSIIAQGTFDAVQGVSRDNSRWSPRRAEPGAWLLRGMVLCGSCKVGTSCHKMRGRNGTFHRYYYCHNHDVLRAGGEEHRCPERNIRADALDAFVLEQVHLALSCPETLLAAEGALAERDGGDDADVLTSQLARLDRRIEGVRNERRRLADIYQAGLIEAGDLKRRSRETDARLKRLGSERETLTERSAEVAAKDTLNRAIGNFSEHALAGWEVMEHGQKQRLLRAVLESVRVKGCDVELRFRIPLDGPPTSDADHSPPAPPARRPRVPSQVRLRSLGGDRGRLLPAQAAEKGGSDVNWFAKPTSPSCGSRSPATRRSARGSASWRPSKRTNAPSCVASWRNATSATVDAIPWRDGAYVISIFPVTPCDACGM